MRSVRTETRIHIAQTTQLVLSFVICARRSASIYRLLRSRRSGLSARACCMLTASMALTLTMPCVGDEF